VTCLIFELCFFLFWGYFCVTLKHNVATLGNSDSHYEISLYELISNVAIRKRVDWPYWNGCGVSSEWIKQDKRKS
jgi:hypothetical protein